MVDELIAAGADRLFVRLRFAIWRRDLPTLRQLYNALPVSPNVFIPGIAPALFEVLVDDGWPKHRNALLAITRIEHPDRRLRTFRAQLVAELAAYGGDAATAHDVIAHAVPDGLFDIHWLAHCPLLADVRALPAYAALHGALARRAGAVFDALYGEPDDEGTGSAVVPSLIAVAR